MLRKILLVYLLLLLPTSYGFAATQPDQLIKDITEQVLTSLKEERIRLKENPEKVYEYVTELAEKHVLPHYDFRKMSRWILGKNWRKASKQQQQQFIDNFREMLIRTYATALLAYSDQEIVYFPFRSKKGARSVVVRAEFRQKGAPAIPVHYRLSKDRKSGKWKVFDVAIDGISLVTNYRSSFAIQIRKSGMQGLIATLSNKNSESKKKSQ